MEKPDIVTQELWNTLDDRMRAFVVEHELLHKEMQERMKIGHLPYVPAVLPSGGVPDMGMMNAIIDARIEDMLKPTIQVEPAVSAEEVFRKLMESHQHKPKPAPTREEAIEEACQALDLTHEYSITAFITRRHQMEDIPDLKASSMEAACAMARDHFWDNYHREEEDDEFFPNVSIYVSNYPQLKHGTYDMEFEEFNIDGRQEGEPWAFKALEIVQALAKAETDEARQALVVEAREALKVDRAPSCAS